MQPRLRIGVTGAAGTTSGRQRFQVKLVAAEPRPSSPLRGEDATVHGGVFMTRVTFLFSVASLVVVACGARTDGAGPLDLGGPLGSGEGTSLGGGGGGAGRGGTAGSGGVGRGGTAGSGGVGRGGTAGFGAVSGYGGCGEFGCAAGGCFDCNVGGYYGGGGYATGGASGSCAFPTCGECPDCFSQCLCVDSDPAFCESVCYGGGAGFSGSGGTGGGGCEPALCPTSSGGSPIVLQGCCTNYGACGIDTTALEGFLQVPLGCEDRSEPGFDTTGCAPMKTPLDSQPVLAGCCRSDGRCGVDLGSLGLGCVLNTGQPAYCNLPDGGTGGFYGAGGSPGTGGFYGNAGTPGSGASPGAGGAAAQCAAQATSECETCACESCTSTFLSCFADAGCPQILQCANEVGCTGINCYQPSTCQKVIDATGGPSSASVAIAIPLFQCLASAGCDCGFASAQ